MRVTIYTDGSARGNPGPGGYGTVLLYTDTKGECHRRELSGGFKKTTNNRMEDTCAIVGPGGAHPPLSGRVVFGFSISGEGL